MGRRGSRGPQGRLDGGVDPRACGRVERPAESPLATSLHLLIAQLADMRVLALCLAAALLVSQAAARRGPVEVGPGRVPGSLQA